MDHSLRSPSITGGALKKAAVTGLPLGREFNVPVVAVASGVPVGPVAVAAGVPASPVAVRTASVEVVSGGGSVGGKGVLVDVTAKIAV